MKTTAMKLYLIIILVVCITACNPSKNSQQEIEQEQVPEAEQLTEETETISNIDSTYVASFISKLKGIEKYAVKTDFYLMASLLEYRGDTVSSNRITDILKKKDEYVMSYIIEELDSKSGYMRYAPRGAEVVYTTTYWNMKNGSDLIALEARGCGPICESEIGFVKFENGNYSNLAIQNVIPAIDSLPTELLPDYQPGGDPVEFQYLLPRKGKSIQFCLEDNCLELIWNDGVFKLNNK